MTEFNPEAVVEIDGRPWTLADIAGLNMDGVTAVRWSRFPGGNYNWEITTETGLAAVDSYESGAKQPAIKVVFKCLEVLKIDAGTNAEEWLGEKHTETFYLSRDDALGRFKALVEDCGCAPPPGSAKPVGEWLAPLAGWRVNGDIVITSNKNDTSKHYHNLRNVKPLQQTVAAPTTQPTQAPTANPFFKA